MTRRSHPSAILSRASFACACAGALVGLAALAGCGRAATDADCDLILDRNVEVQMKALHINDPSSVEKRKAEIRTEMKGQIKDCVGKRVTDGMLACVKSAQTADELDRCMR